MPRSLIRLLRPTLACLLWVSASVPGAEAARGTARLGQAVYEPVDGVIVVPFEGAAPRATLHKLSDRHFYYELAPARLAREGTQRQVLNGPLKRFALANRPEPDAARLSFELDEPGAPVFRVDAAHGRLVFWPLGLPDPTIAGTDGGLPVYQAPGLPMPHLAPGLPTGLGRPFIAHEGRRVVFPYQGAAPRYALRPHPRNPRWLIVDFPGADAAVTAPWHGVFADPLFDAWMISPRPEPHHTRIYVRLTRPAEVQVHLDPARSELWLQPPPPLPALVSPLPSPLPLPSVVIVPEAPILPGSPAPGEPGDELAVPSPGPLEPLPVGEGPAPMLLPRPDSAN